MTCETLLRRWSADRLGYEDTTREAGLGPRIHADLFGTSASIANAYAGGAANTVLHYVP